MTELEPGVARALGNTIIDYLPDYQIGRAGVARDAGVDPAFVERLYDATVPVDPAVVTMLATFLGIDVETYAENARQALARP